VYGPYDTTVDTDPPHCSHEFDTYLSIKNRQKKCFDTVTALSLVTTFWVISYIRNQNIFFTIWSLEVSKNAEFNADFKNINLP
jgi:hypothetical protein